MALNKYFGTETLLGIGIGFILSAVIVAFFPPTVQYSDEEIINRAKQLGMHTKEEFESRVRINDGIDVQTEPVDQPVSKEPAQTESRSPVSDIEGTVKISVPSGASSEKIARILRDAKVIDDISEFEARVYQMGVQKKFQKGDFEVPLNSELAEIIKILISKPNAN